MYKDKYIFPAVFFMDNDGVSIEFPDLPGCLPCAKTPDEAFINAREALYLHLYGMEQDGDEIPEATPFTELEIGKNEVVVLIDVLMPQFRDKMAQKSVTTTVTMPRWLRNMADSQSINMSQVLQQGLKEKLGIYDYSQISKPKRGQKL